MHKTYYIDTGHGGIINGKYTTAPKKMFRHNDKIAYEGVINRHIGYSFYKKLKEQSLESIILDSNMDIPLRQRINIINNLYGKYNNLVNISIHSNASKYHNARGFEIWTSKGETKSDSIASIFGKQIMQDFPDIPFRTGYYDPEETKIDLDKEEDYDILTLTNCSAILIENLFFDNSIDYEFLQSINFIDKLTDSYLLAVKKLELLAI